MQQHRGSYGRNGRSIPVYVHVIYSNSQENISDAQIQSQLDQLNADFAASNADYNPPSDFASVAAGNTGIQFTLEQVTRKSSSRTSWGTNDDMKKTSQGGVAAVTPST
ncbi:MAG: zinc metalloprotease, partial [Aureispira sp.]